MKTLFLRFFTLLLCCLLLSSCSAPVLSQTVSTEQTATQPVSTEPAKPDGKALYAAAVEKLKGAFVSATVTTEAKQAFGKDTVSYLSNTQVLYSDYKGEGEKMSEVTTMVNSDFKMESVYLDGTLYTASDSLKYKKAMDQQEFGASRTPVELFSPENYSQIQAVEQSDGGYLITFSAPSKTELYLEEDFSFLEETASHLVSPLLCIQGQAKLGPDGSLTENTVTAFVETGRFYYGVKIDVQLTDLAQTEIAVPEKAEEYQLLEAHGFDPAWIMDQAVYDFVSADRGSCLYNEAHVATVWNASFQKGDSYIFNAKESLSKYTSTVNVAIEKDTASSNLEEIYKDGVLSYVENGESGQEKMAFREVHQLRLEECVKLFPTSDAAQIGAVNDAGIAWEIEFAYDAEVLDALLEENAQIFTTGYTFQELLELMERKEPSQKSATGSLFVSKDSYQPISLFVEYLATVPYEGVDHRFAGAYHFLFFPEYAGATAQILGDEAVWQDPDMDVTPPLYQVTGANGEKMWLLGTIHVGDPRTAFLPQELYDALDGADALAVEYNVVELERQLKSDPQLMAEYVKSLSYADSSTVKDHLSEQNYEDLGVWMKMFGLSDNSSLSAYFFYQNFASGIIELNSRLSQYNGVDRALIARAEKAEKPILNIEAKEVHVGVPEGYDDSIQQFLLEELFKEESTDDALMVTWLSFEAWCASDMEVIESLSGLPGADASQEEKRYDALMMRDRNKAMLEKAKEYLSGDQQVFFAVGVAHLVGEDGLINTLTQAGYTVTPVSYA